LILMREPMGNRGDVNAQNDEEEEDSEDDGTDQGMDWSDRIDGGEQSDGDGEEDVD
jgi:hypothetical protein